ncbi:hypothetical protein V8D89_005117 [Ganoderma adspersum]
MSFNLSTQPRIAIIGGDPRRPCPPPDPPPPRYLRDPSTPARTSAAPSISDGRAAAAQRALRENGLQDEFDRHSCPEGEDMRICDSTGKVHLKLCAGEGEDGGPPQGKEDIRPEIDRTVLRKFLLDAVPAHLVQWDHALSSVRALGAGQHELTFENGLATTCDLLVGADGAHSRVRTLLSPATLHFLGVTGAEISLALSTATLPELAQTVANVSQGTMMAIADTRMLGAQVNGDDRLRTYAFLRASRVLDHPRHRAQPRGDQGGAGGALRLVGAHVPGVTFIGDAVHLMSPFVGAGANLALTQLKKGMLGKAGAVSAAVAAFEENMCAIAGRVAEKAKGILEVCVGPAAIKRFGEVAAAGEREG